MRGNSVTRGHTCGQTPSKMTARAQNLRRRVNITRRREVNLHGLPRIKLLSKVRNLQLDIRALPVRLKLFVHELRIISAVLRPQGFTQAK